MAFLIVLGIAAAFFLGFICGVVVTAIAAASHGIKGMEKSRRSAASPSLFDTRVTSVR